MIEESLEELKARYAEYVAEERANPDAEEYQGFGYNAAMDWMRRRIIEQDPTWEQP